MTASSAAATIDVSIRRFQNSQMVHHPPQLTLVRDGGAPSHCAAFGCAEIIHPDMPWNPARLEQRNGRIDRVASLSKARGCHVRIGVPFLEQSYERFQFDRLLSRAKLFQVLLGTLDFDATDVDQGDDGETIREADPEAAADRSNPEPLLPEALAKWRSVDLSVWQASDQAP